MNQDSAKEQDQITSTTDYYWIALGMEKHGNERNHTHLEIEEIIDIWNSSHIIILAQKSREKSWKVTQHCSEHPLGTKWLLKSTAI